jgi:hypothetical protein
LQNRRVDLKIPADSGVLRAGEHHHRVSLDLLYPFLASAELLVARSTGAAGHQGRRRPLPVAPVRSGLRKKIRWQFGT